MNIESTVAYNVLLNISKQQLNELKVLVYSADKLPPMLNIDHFDLVIKLRESEIHRLSQYYPEISHRIMIFVDGLEHKDTSQPHIEEGFEYYSAKSGLGDNVIVLSTIHGYSSKLVRTNAPGVYTHCLIKMNDKYYRGCEYRNFFGKYTFRIFKKSNGYNTALEASKQDIGYKAGLIY